MPRAVLHLELPGIHVAAAVELGHVRGDEPVVIHRQDKILDLGGELPLRRGQPLRLARKLAPRAAFVPVGVLAGAETYRAVWDTLTGVGPSLEPTAWHAGYVDVSGCLPRQGTKAYLAQVAHQLAALTGQPPTQGVGANKLIARHASPWGEIVGLRETLPFLHAQRLRPDQGLTRPMIERLDELGCHRWGEVAEVPEPRLRALFGVRGTVLHRWSQGVDPRPVQSRYPPPMETIRVEVEVDEDGHWVSRGPLGGSLAAGGAEPARPEDLAWEEFCERFVEATSSPDPFSASGEGESGMGELASSGLGTPPPDPLPASGEGESDTEQLALAPTGTCSLMTDSPSPLAGRGSGGGVPRASTQALSSLPDRHPVARAGCGCNAPGWPERGGAGGEVADTLPGPLDLFATLSATLARRLQRRGEVATEVRLALGGRDGWQSFRRRLARGVDSADRIAAVVLGLLPADLDPWRIDEIRLTLRGLRLRDAVQGVLFADQEEERRHLLEGAMARVRARYGLMGLGYGPELLADRERLAEVVWRLEGVIV